MKLVYKQIVTAIFIAASSLPAAVMAESNTAADPAVGATARLDFRITIPGVLRFRVGSAGIGNVDIIDFDPPAASLGNSAVTTQGTGGDGTGPGMVTVDLFSNTGPVTISEENNGSGNGLSTGPGPNNDTIPYSEIITTSNDPATFAAPQLSDSAKNTSAPTPTSGNGKVTNRTTTWSYAYANTATYPEGTYGGADTNGGRVTYTAATP